MKEFLLCQHSQFSTYNIERSTKLLDIKSHKSFVDHAAARGAIGIATTINMSVTPMIERTQAIMAEVGKSASLKSNETG